MRITIGPTGPDPRASVAIEHPSDHLDIVEIRELLRSALLAWGFVEATVDELLGEE